MKFVLFNEGHLDGPRNRRRQQAGAAAGRAGWDAGHHRAVHRVSPALTALAQNTQALPLESVMLKAPLPRATVLAMGGNYRENGDREPSPMWGFVKSTDSIVGT